MSGTSTAGHPRFSNSAGLPDRAPGPTDERLGVRAAHKIRRRPLGAPTRESRCTVSGSEGASAGCDELLGSRSSHRWDFFPWMEQCQTTPTISDVSAFSDHSPQKEPPECPASISSFVVCLNPSSKILCRQRPNTCCCFAEPSGTRGSLQRKSRR